MQFLVRQYVGCFSRRVGFIVVVVSFCFYFMWLEVFRSVVIIVYVVLGLWGVGFCFCNFFCLVIMISVSRVVVVCFVGIVVFWSFVVVCFQDGWNGFSYEVFRFVLRRDYVLEVIKGVVVGIDLGIINFCVVVMEGK